MEQEKSLQLISSLKGQTVDIPNLYPIFAGWSANDVNPIRQLLTKKLHEWYRSLPISDAKRITLEAADFGLAAALWFPRAGFDELCTFSFYTVWLFIVDDEIDEPTGTYADSPEAAVSWCNDVLVFVRYHLKLDSHNSAPIVSDPLISSFKEIGELISAVYSTEQRKIFFDELVLYLGAIRREQELRLKCIVPTVAVYWTMRFHSSACGTTNSLIDLANKVRVPYAIMKSPNIERLCDEATLIIALVNDMLSLKKEIRNECVYSHLPLAYAENGNLQLAVDEAVMVLRSSVERFDSIADKILSMPNDAGVSRKHIQGFVTSLRENCVANLTFTLASKRYSLAKDIREDGSVWFTL